MLADPAAGLRVQRVADGDRKHELEGEEDEGAT
jgi:hypothetical protein